MNNKYADQIARMHRLVCSFVVPRPPKTGFLVSRPSEQSDLGSKPEVHMIIGALRSGFKSVCSHDQNEVHLNISIRHRKQTTFFGQNFIGRIRVDIEFQTPKIHSRTPMK